MTEELDRLLEESKILAEKLKELKAKNRELLIELQDTTRDYEYCSQCHSDSKFMCDECGFYACNNNSCSRFHKELHDKETTTYQHIIYRLLIDRLHKLDITYDEICELTNQIMTIFEGEGKYA